MVHNGLPSLYTVLTESSDEGDIASGEGGASNPQPLRVQHGDPDYPNHDHTITEKHSNTSNHLDGPGADRHTITRYRAPLQAAVDLSGGIASIDPCSVD
jgi:hypothetical protein